MRNRLQAVKPHILPINSPLIVCGAAFWILFELELQDGKRIYKQSDIGFRRDARLTEPMSAEITIDLNKDLKSTFT